MTHFAAAHHGCWSSPRMAVQVMVPLSNAEILASSSAQYINTTVQEVCWEVLRHCACVHHPACMHHAATYSTCWPASRRPSTTPQTWHGVSLLVGAACTAACQTCSLRPLTPATAGLSNELSFDSSCQPLSKCFPKLIAAAQQIASMDTSSRPIVITSIFDANFATAASVKQAFVSAGAQALLTTACELAESQIDPDDMCGRRRAENALQHARSARNQHVPPAR